MSEMVIHDFIKNLLDLEERWAELPLVERRQTIEEFQKRVQELETEAPHKPEHRHFFGSGTYGREAFMPKGVVMVGSIYTEPQINILIRGVVFVATENSIKLLEGPQIFVSDPNTKKVGYVVEDMQWITIMSRDNSVVDPAVILKTHTAEDYGG